MALAVTAIIGTLWILDFGFWILDFGFHLTFPPSHLLTFFS
jgi:hypothetical protein